MNSGRKGALGLAPPGAELHVTVEWSECEQPVAPSSLPRPGSWLAWSMPRPAGWRWDSGRPCLSSWSQERQNQRAHMAVWGLRASAPGVAFCLHGFSSPVGHAPECARTRMCQEGSRADSQRQAVISVRQLGVSTSSGEKQRKHREDEVVMNVSRWDCGIAPGALTLAGP